MRDFICPPTPFSTRQRYFPSSPCLTLVRFNTGPRESTFPGSESLIQVTFACRLLSFMIHCNVIDSSSVVLRSLGYAGSMMGGSGQEERITFNHFNAKGGQRQNSSKFLNWEKQIIPLESTVNEDSFEWSHYRISSTDSKLNYMLNK